MLRNVATRTLKQSQSMVIRYQSTLPSLTNLNASWNGLSTEEKQSVYTDIVERQKEDWKELSVDEKRAGGFPSLTN